MPCFDAIESVAEAADARGVGVTGEELAIASGEVGCDGDDLAGACMDDGASAIAGYKLGRDLYEFGSDADDLA